MKYYSSNNTKPGRSLLVLLLAGTLFPASAFAQNHAISLAGQWAFKLDPEKVGLEQKWYQSSLPDRIKLPGSTDEAGFGTKNTEKETTRLSRVYKYVGPAWYQREITIPKSWADKRITLFLERCHWETQIWVDEQFIGMQESLCVPHIYDPTEKMTPGKHRITIRVDNNPKYDVGHWTLAYVKTTQYWAHSVTDDTQTNWNGIIGRIALEATDPVWIESIQIYPDIHKKAAKVIVEIGNSTGKDIEAKLSLQTRQGNEEKTNPPHDQFITVSKKQTTVETNITMGPDVKLWDEFSPNLYELTASLTTRGEHKYADSKKTQFGMRQVGVKGKKITINDRPTFLRGNLDCCIFPLTGYPDMDAQGWLRMFKIAKSYGLNHIRYHSWCPPKAAFVAADRLGLMLHVETPVWTEVGASKPVDKFIYDEADRILEAYGNHPSFTMLCVGNELAGKKSTPFCAKINKYWKEKDPRRLYTGGSGWPESPTADYLVISKNRKRLPLRLHRGPMGPATNADYQHVIASYDKPIVAHEIAEWCVYPNFNEIKKYTGTLRARNFEVFRDSLTKNHMLDQAPDFLKSSGILSDILFKAEIETMLRTPTIAGFHLLSLQDFPGQGTSLVGTLDAFWDSKGLIEPADFRKFCCETVPLLRMPKRIYTPAEALVADVEIAHFGQGPIINSVPSWSIRYPDGRKLTSGDFDETTIPLGNGTKLGTINVPLTNTNAPTKLIVTVELKNTPYENQWPIWVYPASAKPDFPENVIIADSLNNQVESALQEGKRVLLVPQKLSPELSRRSSFEPIFWNNRLFDGQDRHLGILCNPKHPLFKQFPTEFHTNWQWWDLLNKSTAMVMDNFDPEFRPLIQVIDDWCTNRRLGFMFEANVAKGKLLVSSLDLLNDLGHRPAAKQLLISTLNYMDSDKFKPKNKIDMKIIRELCKTPQQKE